MLIIKLTLEVIFVSLGSAIKNYRKLNNYTQLQVANKLGVSRIYVQAIESGRREPSMKLLLRIAEVLNVKLNDLVAKQSPDNKVQLESVIASRDNDLWFRSKQLNEQERRRLAKIIDACIDDLEN
ncbi:helix-turn-helix transcriptional regulator [uncultured Cloacibacillus sp.]|uniref:helix-turn-helix transcriptional regulator n=1 Tax=uncultured Cloacibacillus sp. TaxID=889794 RepID=UPI0026DBBE1C|nr:helix-turn-helix transcriptional regulator [uncultured Cloacibacillus sp.]